MVVAVNRDNHALSSLISLEYFFFGRRQGQRHSIPVEDEGRSRYQMLLFHDADKCQPSRQSYIHSGCFQTLRSYKRFSDPDR